MKVNFRRVDEKEGFIRKKLRKVLYVSVDVSDEEAEFLQRSPDYIILEYDYDGLELNFRTHSLAKGSARTKEGARFVFDDEYTRASAEKEITEGLKGVKRLLDGREAMGSGETTIEL